MTSILHSERGATLVYVALSSFMILLFLGLATDAGWLVWVRTQGKKRIDAAALAAGRALVEQIPATRATKATTLANTFSGQNLVVDASTNPANTVTPMRFDLTTGVLTDLGSDWNPGETGENCNAVKVTTTIPTPVFFAGVRSFISGAAEAATNITVSAVAHLPCPGLLMTAAAKLAPIALEQCDFSTADCDPPSGSQDLFKPSTSVDRVVFTTLGTGTCAGITNGPPYPRGLDPELKVGEPIDIVPAATCLPALEARYTSCTTTGQCSDPPDPNCTAVVPIVECGASTVVGFATLCFTKVVSGIPEVRGSLECNEYPSGAGGTSGACLGSYARTPILVQ
jgi:hypothetical protein